MVWFYERHGTFIRCEARDAENGVGFDLFIVRPDGTEHIEHFDDSSTLSRRQVELEASLSHDGWHGPFGQTI